MNYKMVCIDLDGTLFGENRRISESTIEVISEVYKKGIEVVVTTGRLYSNAAQISKQIGVSSPVIAANGAIIRDEGSDKEIYNSSFSYNQCNVILDLIKKHRLFAHFYTTDRVIASSPIANLAALYYRYRNNGSDYKINVDSCISSWTLKKRFKDYEEKIVKCVVYSSDSRRIKAFKKEVMEIDDLTVFGAGRYSAEVNARDVSKGNAIEILADYMNIPRGKIICIGDNENDISMIKYAGVGVAMGNAIPELKEIADYVTDTNINDGVAKAIKKFIL
ncbi:Cof-type HAD-IIB family hydrolase [Clostridium paraputrificum]|uniref:Cof-type HAD-IIB family hydrolase n=1 Tax=Clostridium TaxID=1485 RepID=UPI003D331445